MDLLITLHRRLQTVVDRFGLRPLAQKVFRRLYARRYGTTGLARAIQNDREWWLNPDVALRGDFAEFDTIEWLRSAIRPGMTVFDVGANVGQMTLEMAHLVGPSGRVIAIEPAAGNLALLDAHISANGFSERVQVIRAACAETDGGQLPLLVLGSGDAPVGSGHSLNVERALTEGELKLEKKIVHVPLVSVDGVCQRLGVRPDLLKIDVEGAELLVLKGSRNALRSARPKVRFGFHPHAFSDPGAASAEVRQILKECGYSLEQDSGQPLALEEYSANPTELVAGSAAD